MRPCFRLHRVCLWRGRVQCCQAIKRSNVIPQVIHAMVTFVDAEQPLLPWVLERQAQGRVGSDLDISSPVEPRLAHYCAQIIANLACDDKSESAYDIPTFQVHRPPSCR